MVANEAMSLETQEFFERHPVVVANDLIDRELWVSNHRVVIAAALPQIRSDNSRWIDERPLFTDPEVTAYVAPYRGSHLMFLRTNPGTCVRIESVTTRAGDTLKKPGQVCRELGLDAERLGSVALENDIVTIHWQRKN